MTLRRFLLAIAAAIAALVAPVSQALAADAPPPARFSVTVEGEGSDVIFIPGLVSGRGVWDGAVRSLDGQYRVHRIQLAGFAGEPARGNAEGGILPGVVSELHDYIRARRAWSARESSAIPWAASSPSCWPRRIPAMRAPS